jgi:hypothetical protein
MSVVVNATPLRLEIARRGWNAVIRALRSAPLQSVRLTRTSSPIGRNIEGNLVCE